MKCSLCTAWQALVDIVTPAAVFEAVDAAVTAHMAGTAAAEFTGEHICVAVRVVGVQPPGCARRAGIRLG